MKDFLAFRTMVTPIIIQVIFWIGVIVCVIAGIILIGVGAQRFDGSAHILKGLLVLVAGPLVVRIYCEILIIFFRINETLTEINHAVGDHRPKPAE